MPTRRETETGVQFAFEINPQTNKLNNDWVQVGNERVSRSHFQLAEEISSNQNIPLSDALVFAADLEKYHQKPVTVAQYRNSREYLPPFTDPKKVTPDDYAQALHKMAEIQRQEDKLEASGR